MIIISPLNFLIWNQQKSISRVGYTHEFDYFLRRHPCPLAKLSLLCAVSQEIDFLVLPAEPKEEPMFLYNICYD